MLRATPSVEVIVPSITGRCASFWQSLGSINITCKVFGDYINRDIFITRRKRKLPFCEPNIRPLTWSASFWQSLGSINIICKVFGDYINRDIFITRRKRKLPFSEPNVRPLTYYINASLLKYNKLAIFFSNFCSHFEIYEVNQNRQNIIFVLCFVTQNPIIVLWGHFLQILIFIIV